ncbi:MAG: hypothetical protein AB7G15_03290 [Alphaproteobacteria bacterium]
MTDRFKAAQSDVSKIFDAPADIVGAGDLSKSQKVALLRQWEIDLRQLMVASDENMPETPARNLAGERLQRVHAALAQLGAESDPDQGAPTKAG